MPKMRRGRALTCILCRHCYLDGGMRGYSEYTPSSPMSLECRRGHWELDVQGHTANHAEFRSMMLSAGTCEDFEWYEEED